MKSPLKIGLNLLTIGLIGMGVYSANRANSAGSLDAGYIPSTALEAINTLEGCAVVANGQNRFIPTRSWVEWNAAKTALPPQGASFIGCNTYIAGGGAYESVGDACGGAGDCAGDSGGDAGDF